MSIERVIMLKLRKGKDLVLARIVSFELSKEIPEVESWFYLSKNDQLQSLQHLCGEGSEYIDRRYQL
jgi:hypothetical protein